MSAETPFCVDTWYCGRAQGHSGRHAPTGAALGWLLFAVVYLLCLVVVVVVARAGAPS